MEADFITYLLGYAPLTALVGQRIQPRARTQGDPLPGLTVSRISGGAQYAGDGEIGIQEVRVQVDAWASTYREAATIADAVFERLSATADVTQGGTTFKFIEQDMRQDLHESGSQAAEYPYRVQQDFIVVATV